MPNDNYNKKRFCGLGAFKSGVRIVVLSFLAICGIILLLYAGIIVYYCSGGIFENRVASLKDLCVYIFASDSKRNTWEFSPGDFDFEHTNRIYVMEFRPQLARKHEVYFSHSKVEALNIKHIEKLVNGVALQIAVYNALTGALYEKVTRVGFSTSHNKSTPIYVFSTADLPWKYTDKLRIEIAPMVLNVRLEGLESEMNKTELRVSESVPFY